MNVILIFRSRLLHKFSIEKVFKTVKEAFPIHLKTDSLHVKHPGFRISNLLHIKRSADSRNSTTVYHVTGDIHYIVFSLPRKRCILTVHDCVFLNTQKGFKRWILKKLFLDWPVWYVPVITAISEKTRGEIISLTNCNPDKVRVINNPVPSGICFSKKAFNNIKPALLFIGSTPNKNLSGVIEAIRDFPCTLNIIGIIDAALVAKLKAFNIEYKLERDLSDEEINIRYKMCDIVLFPSFYEGFGLPVLEGFTAGRTVLTSNISPLKEVSGGAAWLVDPYNTDSINQALKQIVREPESREKKIEMGKRIAADYSCNRIASQYVAVYEELFEGMKRKDFNGCRVGDQDQSS